MHPEGLVVPGVNPDDVWRLFNVSNYAYYKQTVADLQAGRCPFCDIDPAINKVLFENESWRLWKNEMAPRSGQECQLVVPSKRHVENLLTLTRDEIADTHDVFQWAYVNLGLGAGVWVIRTGYHRYNAKSVPHLHYNFHRPTGRDRVEITIAKSEEDLRKKLPLLIAFEAYRVAESEGARPMLTPEQWALIEGRLEPPKTAK